MVGKLQPLVNNQRIVGPDGLPTEYFIRWAQQRQIDIGDAIDTDQALEIVVTFLADHPLIAGSGINLTPSGNIAEDVTISAEVQAILDQISTTWGSVLFRGENDWEALAPGTAGQFLKTNGAGADPEWAAAGGGGGGVAWTLIAATTIAAPTTFVEFDVTGYNEVFGFAQDVIATATSRRSWQVSVDAGASWLTTSGNYTSYSGSGALTNAALILGTDTDSALARSTALELSLDAMRDFKILNRNLTNGFVPGATAKIDRLRFGASNTAVLGTTTVTAGTVSVWGR